MANAWAMKPHQPVAVSSATTAAGHDPLNVVNDYSGVVWKSIGGAVGARELLFDFGTPVTVDAVLLFGCTGAKAAWTLLVYGANNVAGTLDPIAYSVVPFLAGAEMPVHGRGVGYWEKEPGQTLAARRYWSIQVQSGSDVVTIGRAALGERLTLERNFAFGAAFGVRDLGSVEFSPTAVLLRRKAAKLRTISLSFPSVHKDEVEAKVQPLIELVAGQDPIALVTDPDVDPMRQRRCYFGPLMGDLGTVWARARQYEWRANLIDLFSIPRSA